MPEGDTVYRAARLLDRSLSGRELIATDFRVPQLATVDLRGGRISETVSRGKHLLTRITHESAAQGWTLHTHLKMEGSWRVFERGRRWSRPVHQARVVLAVEGREAVGFSLGMVDLLPTPDEPSVVGHLGPDLLGAWSADDEAEALRRLRAEPEVEIGDALRDQRNLAGLGNMYVAELLFVSGLHPRRRVDSVTDLARVVRRGRQMLDLNKERAVQSTTGDLRDTRRHWVYRRRTCTRCATPISVDQQGPAGQERTVYFCPACQPLDVAD